MTWYEKAVDFLALLYAVLFFPIPFFWIVIHPAIGFWRRIGKRSYWVALPVWVISGVALVFVRHRLFAGRLERNALTWAAGAALVVLGEWLTHRVHRELGLKRMMGFPEVDPGANPGGVVSTGIYARLRHPRYVGVMLPFFGFASLTGAVGIFLLAIATVLLYYIVAPLEERELRRQYGAAYEAYARTVPRFVPRLGRKSKTVTSL